MPAVQMNFLPVIILLVSFLCGTLQLDNLSNTVVLDDMCRSANRTIVLPCQASSNRRSGSLIFDEYPLSDCDILVKVVPTMEKCKAEIDDGVQYGIHFNIRDLSLQYDDLFEVFEFPRTNVEDISSLQRFKVKSLSGLDDISACRTEPSSCAQLISAYGSSPTLILHFQRGIFQARNPARPFRIDYTVLTRYRSGGHGEVFCSALQGYLRTDLMCSREDRIYCPSSYEKALGLNPAEKKNQGFPAHDQCRSRILTAEIILVGFASLLTLTFVLFCVLFCCKRWNARHEKMDVRSLPSYRTATRPSRLATISEEVQGRGEDGQLDHAFDDNLPHYEELFPPVRATDGRRPITSIENEGSICMESSTASARNQVRHMSSYGI
ncbi:hypothetical protein RvY_08007 [Ramazzottius varieornatus]|uniref:CUB domain-containing protein n=1 Tax=Ramazzottius varieornatus TaxID=947166 RepID=A0A1D1V4A5_RAMVA|nr:hypothetical protein RvY_08007 [Ramazzottius varieornatus]